MTSVQTMSFQTELAPGSAIKFLNAPISNSDEEEMLSEDLSYSDISDEEEEDSDEESSDVSFSFQEEINVRPQRVHYFPTEQPPTQAPKPPTPQKSKRDEEDAQMEEYLALRSAELEQSYQQALTAAQENKVHPSQLSQVLRDDDDFDESSEEDEELDEEDQSIAYDDVEGDSGLELSVTHWVTQINISSRRPR